MTVEEVPQENVLLPVREPDDLPLDEMLRPRVFDEFVGQRQVKENLHIYIEAARKRGEPLDHALFSGPPGLGKTTLANLMAAAMSVSIKSTSGPALERPGDLVGLLTNLQKGDILFIDEVHRISRTVEEYLYSAMESFYVDIVLDQGPSARSVKIPLPRFTLIGATTREGLLTAPFRDRFGVVEKLDYYPPEELAEITMNSAKRLRVPIESEATILMASRARGTPRVANRFLRRVRDVAQVMGSGIITLDVAHEGLRRLGVDENGLCEMDRKILRILLSHDGHAVGLKTVAVAVGEEEDTITDVYEPFLIQSGYIRKSPRGRTPTEKAYREYGKALTGHKGIFE
jgi:holliday junction DNA helicase RuvB